VDWVEKVFHVAPDQGNGVLETLLLVAIVVVVMTLTVRALASLRRK
jgi:hypothetical protein